jgi:uncharacterized protein YggT (Ycf19 family)
MKHFGFWTFMTLFVIVALASSPMVQGMPLSMQLSYFANEALYYLHSILDPALEFIRNLTR